MEVTSLSAPFSPTVQSSHSKPRNSPADQAFELPSITSEPPVDDSRDTETDNIPDWLTNSDPFPSELLDIVAPKPGPRIYNTVFFSHTPYKDAISNGHAAPGGKNEQEAHDLILEDYKITNLSPADWDLYMIKRAEARLDHGLTVKNFDLATSGEEVNVARDDLEAFAKMTGQEVIHRGSLRTVGYNALPNHLNLASPSTDIERSFLEYYEAIGIQEPSAITSLAVSPVKYAKYVRHMMDQGKPIPESFIRQSGLLVDEIAAAGSLENFLGESLEAKKDTLARARANIIPDTTTPATNTIRVSRPVVNPPETDSPQQPSSPPEDANSGTQNLKGLSTTLIPSLPTPSQTTPLPMDVPDSGANSIRVTPRKGNSSPNLSGRTILTPPPLAPSPKVEFSNGFSETERILADIQRMSDPATSPTIRNAENNAPGKVTPSVSYPDISSDPTPTTSALPMDKDPWQFFSRSHQWVDFFPGKARDA